MSGKVAKVGKPKPAQPYTYLAKGISKIGRSAGFRKRALKVPCAASSATRCAPVLLVCIALVRVDAPRWAACGFPIETRCRMQSADLLNRRVCFYFFAPFVRAIA